MGVNFNTYDNCYITEWGYTEEIDHSRK